MSIKTKVLGGLLLVLSLFVGTTFYNYSQAHRSNQRLSMVNDLFLPLSRQLAQIQSNVQVLSDDMRRYFFAATGPREAMALSRMARDLYPFVIRKKFANAERLLANDTVGQAAPEALVSKLAHAKSAFEAMMSTTDQKQFELLLLELRNELLTVSKLADEECQKLTLAVQKEGRDNILSHVGLAALVIILGGVLLLLSNRVLNPLPFLIEKLKKISDGDFHHTLKVKASAKDEVSLLAREFNRMLSALRDRDHKIRSQQNELLRSERLAAIGHLSAEVVHEIRNPLNSMSLNIDWLKEELAHETTERQETLESISREIQRLNQITESYLVRARVNVAEPKRAPVNEIIQEIVSFDREEQSNIAIEAELWPEEIFVKTDRSRLKQAFINVMKNAREAMPGGGTLRVTTEQASNSLRVRFSDTGMGMNETVRRQSFLPFFTTKNNGTGLGLSLTKEVIEEAHGSISCDSEVGRGTTFTFDFPA